ncbi:DUF2750 domain-containing protein [Mucilaginibacter sp.]|uniref:DUF2750 domain-containing protein n=1 Tax=Mucilaginibacter sp. TaxID=1882438 RepID=UPI00260BE63C|nr:DUF2750 domain-containing protein [Mucilaginibacter sp.]
MQIDLIGRITTANNYSRKNMSEDKEITDQAYRSFIEKTAASKLVWGLYEKRGWASSHSAESEDVDLVPLWSERSLAKICAKGDWRGYTPTEIPLTEFLESWCLDLAENEIMIGVNWDANLMGWEAGALSVALDILTQLNEIQSAITFSNYSSIDEFITEVTELLNNDII